MSAESRRLSLVGVVTTAFLAAGFLLAYYDAIQKLVAHWSLNEMYSYGFLVPVISGYLIWLRRSHLWTLPIIPSFGIGALVLFWGLTLMVAGRLSATNLVEEASLPFAVCGLSFLVLGRRMTKALAFPLAYLFTMIPFWDVFTNRLHEPFQLYSAAMGVGALRVLNIPVFHQGVFIELPDVTLEVAQLCSGVNNLVAVLCIGVPMTHYYVTGWLKRGFIMLSAAFIALLSNGLRVATVCLFAYYGIRGPNGDIHGPYSLLRSLAITAVGFLILFWLVFRFADRRGTAGSDAMALPESAKASIRAAAVALVIVMMVAAGTLERWRPTIAVPLNRSLVGLPISIGQWESRRTATIETRLETFDFDEKLVRRYVAPDGFEVQLFLGYLEGQTQGRELAASGLLDPFGALEEQSDSRALGKGHVREVVRSDGKLRTYVTYGFVFDGELIARDSWAKFRTAWNALADRRTNGGVVIAAARLRRGDSLDVARDRYRDFIDGVFAPSVVLLTAHRRDDRTLFGALLTPP